MRTLNPDSRGTGRRAERGREGPVPPSRGVAGPLAGEQAAGSPGARHCTERPAEARTAVPSEQIPGQTALELRPMQPTLWSL
jgi:hypothetical protein